MKGCITDWGLRKETILITGPQSCFESIILHMYLEKTAISIRVQPNDSGKNWGKYFARGWEPPLRQSPKAPTGRAVPDGAPHQACHLGATLSAAKARQAAADRKRSIRISREYTTPRSQPTHVPANKQQEVEGGTIPGDLKLGMPFEPGSSGHRTHARRAHMPRVVLAPLLVSHHSWRSCKNGPRENKQESNGACI